MNTQTAQEFLTRCFHPGETVALLLRKESPASTTQRIVTLEQATASRYLAWLRYENHDGANVYVAANPLRSGSRKRTKDCIAEVRHLYLDIDVDGDNRIAALMESEAVPVPTAILSTSPDKYQVLWQVEGFDFDRQESTLKQLAIAFGGDSACTDRNRVLRVPGFRNCKYDPAHPVGSNTQANLSIVLRTSGWMIPFWIPCSLLEFPLGHTRQRRTLIRSRIGLGLFSSFRLAKMLGSSHWRLLRAAQISPTLFTTPSALSTSLLLVSR